MLPTSIIVVMCSLTQSDFILCLLLAANQTLFKYVVFLSYKNVSKINTVRSQCSVIVIPVNEINFSIHLTEESSLALPRELTSALKNYLKLTPRFGKSCVLIKFITSKTILKTNESSRKKQFRII